MTVAPIRASPFCASVTSPLMVLVCAMSCRHPMTNNATRSKLLFAKFWIAFIVLLLGCV
ncbi:Uncharacterised protein [Segatella copri]|nr:Uncharacterised protein [Segatella copri]